MRRGIDFGSSRMQLMQLRESSFHEPRPACPEHPKQRVHRHEFYLRFENCDSQRRPRHQLGGYVSLSVTDCGRCWLKTKRSRPSIGGTGYWNASSSISSMRRKAELVTKRPCSISCTTAGVIFYRPGLFGGPIVLDQNWALELSTPCLIERKILPLLRGYGRFSRADLEPLIWSSYTVVEQQTFPSMMESCGICLKAQRLSDEEWEYIAPELLPEWAGAQEQLLGRLRDEPPTSEPRAFPSESLMPNFGSERGDALVGTNGKEKVIAAFHHPHQYLLYQAVVRILTCS